MRLKLVSPSHCAVLTVTPQLRYMTLASSSLELQLWHLCCHRVQFLSSPASQALPMFFLQVIKVRGKRKFYHVVVHSVQRPNEKTTKNSQVVLPMSSVVGKPSEHRMLQAGCIAGPPPSTEDVPGSLPPCHSTLHILLFVSSQLHSSVINCQQVEWKHTLTYPITRH